MKLPKKIEVSGFILSIEYKDKLGSGEEERWGEYVNNKMTLVKGMPPARKKEIFLHEFIHFIEDIYRLNLSEEDVSCIALGMLQLLNNKKIGWDY